jgi:putative acetyltransferase
VSLTIRDARDEDAEGLCALIEPIFGEYEGVLFLIEEMPELLRIRSAFDEMGGAFWCAERGGTIVGCVGYAPHGDGVELKKLYVAASERKQGLGAQLVDRVEAAARARGAGFVELWSDSKFVTAHRFYQRRGYVHDGRTRALDDASHTIEFYFRRDV